MASTMRTKAADRQAVIKKLLPLLKKHYKVTIPKLDRPVMETMLYAVCLENATVEEAEVAYERLFKLFPDLNEARVSSIAEIEPVFAGMEDVDWRAFRARSVLQYVFEKSFNFELEGIRKKTLELASKQLAKIRHLTPFVRALTLQQALGAHILPIDDSSARLLVWLGLAAPEQSLEEVGDALKAVVRKADALQFCFSLRCLATDRKLRAGFDPAQYPPPEGGHDAATAIDRVQELWKSGLASLKVKAKAPAPAAADKAPAKTAAKKASAAPAKKDKAPAKPAAKAAAPAKKAAKKAKAT